MPPLTYLRSLILCVALLWAHASTAARAGDSKEYVEGPPVWIVVSSDSSCSATDSGILNPKAIIYEDRTYITNTREGGEYVRRTGVLAEDESAEITKHVEPLLESSEEHSIFKTLEERSNFWDSIEVRIFHGGVSKRVSIICWGTTIPQDKIGTGEGQVPANIASLIQMCLSLPTEDSQEWTPNYVLLRPLDRDDYRKGGPGDVWPASLPELDFERLKQATSSKPYLLELTKMQYADLAKLQRPHNYPGLALEVQGKVREYEVNCVFPGQNQWLDQNVRPSFVAVDP
jgi:hypothetical protein